MTAPAPPELAPYRAVLVRPVAGAWQVGVGIAATERFSGEAKVYRSFAGARRAALELARTSGLLVLHVAK